MNNYSVIIIDDNFDRRESVEMLINIQQDMQCIATFSDAFDIVKRISAYKTDVILMDIDMPIIDGIQAVQQIREAKLDVKIIMQTVFEDEKKITHAISAGANGYILKKSEPLKLIEGIREVMNGGSPLTSTVAKFLLEIIQNQTPKPKFDIPEFTSREKEVLSLMVDGLSYKMIAEQLCISQFTVNAHIRNIYEKMQVKSMTEAVALAIKHRII